MGTKSSVEKLTAEDCAALRDQTVRARQHAHGHRRRFDPDEIVTEIKDLTADWKPANLAPLDLPKVEMPEAFTEKFITMPEAAQLQFFMGQVGVRRSNPDYYKLLVMDYVLGTGTGFTDRLSASLRDREGLAYTVSANITSSAGEEPGMFSCYIGTEAKNIDRVKKEFLEELDRIRSEPPKQKEVADVKKYLLGSLPFQFATNEADCRPAALCRTVPSRLRLPGRLPQSGRSRDAGRRPGSGPQIHRPDPHGPSSRRRHRRQRQTTAARRRRKVGRGNHE